MTSPEGWTVLSSVASDILGASGRDMIEALQRGEDDPEQLAELASGRLRAKLPQLRGALEGRSASTIAFCWRCSWTSSTI